MECPKCGYEVDDKAMVCPNCKKVLKLVCPICKTVNKSNTCKKCGYVIITKCHKCGKVNPTERKKCAKCGFSTLDSVILNESNLDDYACLTIDFPNMDEMKIHLGSAKLLNKFKVNLDNIILDAVKELGLRRQIIDNRYVIRFNKDYTFSSSAHNAMESVVKIATEITKLNYKLTNLKNASVRCNMMVLKRNVKTAQSDHKIDFNISMVNTSASKEEKALNTFQVITDAQINDCLSSEYKLTPLNSVMINGKMEMFYEMDVRPLININYAELLPKEEEEIVVPNFVQNMLIEQDKIDGQALRQMDSPNDPDAIYDIETINFNEINCYFERIQNIDVFDKIVERLKENPKSITAIKTDPLYVPYSLKVITEVEQTGLYNNIISVTCYDEMKYSPYSFFRDLLSSIFEYTVSQKLFSQNDFSMFNSLDPTGLVKDLVTLTDRGLEMPEDTRYTYYDIFLTILKAIPNTLIFIENFDKIDESSYDVMKYLFEAFDQLEISYLISYDKDFSLHRQSHFLLSKPYYSELYMKPTPFEKMIEGNKEYYKNILDDFYFHRIAKYSCGSILFLDIALQYLVESEVYTADDTTVYLSNPKTIIIPSSLNKLLKRRLNLMQDEPDMMKFLATVLLLGTRIDRATLDSLGYENLDEIIDKLAHMGYLYFYNNCMYFPNYNLLRENLLGTMNKETLQQMANELFEKVLDDSMPSPVKSYLYGLLGDTEAQLAEWQKLMQVNLSLGDFNSYLNCANEILKILDKNKDEEKQEEIENYKLELYENISNNLYEYVPEKTQEIAEVTLANLEKTTNIEQIIQLCNKMITGCMAVGDYNHALELMHKVLSLLPGASIDPLAPNFNQYLLLMSIVHIEILFNIGAMNECIEVGYRVLSIVSQNNIDTVKPEHISTENFKSMIFDSVGYVAIANILQLQGNLKQFFDIVRSNFSDLPQSYELFLSLESLIRGEIVQPQSELVSDDDKFSGVIFHIINAFQNISFDYVAFAEEIYQAKVLAKIAKLHQVEYCCDALIGYAYMKLESYVKASAILFKIIKTANINGMMTLLYLAWYLMCEMNLKQGKYNVAYGIVNNSIIQLEKNNNSCEYLTILFRYALYKVFMFQGEADKADICLQQAQYMTNKYGIHFEFDTDPAHYIPIEENAEQQDGEVGDLGDSDSDSDDDEGEIVGPVGVPHEQDAS